MKPMDIVIVSKDKDLILLWAHIKTQVAKYTTNVGAWEFGYFKHLVFNDF